MANIQARPYFSYSVASTNYFCYHRENLSEKGGGSG
jgi:hypothetical protein